MSKIRLDLNALRVETFDPRPGDSRDRGTVLGHSGAYDTGEACPDFTADFNAFSCNILSCRVTCHLSCGGSCGGGGCQTAVDPTCEGEPQCG
jgi:hypothetical protein